MFGTGKTAARVIHPREILLTVGAGLLLVLGFLLLLGASTTWLVLVLGAIGIAAVLAWSKSVDDSLLFLFLFALPISLSKALVVQGGVYAPGLSLTLSDLLFLPLLCSRAYKSLFVERNPVLLHGVQRYSLLFVVFLWFSALTSETVLGGSLAALTDTKYLCMYWLLTDMVRSRARLQLVLVALGSGLLLQDLYALAQVAAAAPLAIQGFKPSQLGTNLVFDIPGGLRAYRPSGTMLHPNVLADYLTFMLPPAIALLLLARPSLGRWGIPVVLLAALSATALTLTLSRGGWLSFLAGTLVLAAIAVRKRTMDLQRALLFAGLLALFFATVATLFPATLLRITAPDGHSTEARLAMMDQALLVIEHHPLLGVGFGAYNQAAQNILPESYALMPGAFRDALLKGVVHNKYLLVASEHGLIGLLLFLFLFWNHFKLFFLVRQWRTRFEFALAAGITGALAAQAVFYLFDHFYNDVRIALLWVFFGIQLAIVRLQPTMVAKRERLPVSSPAASGTPP